MKPLNRKNLWLFIRALIFAAVIIIIKFVIHYFQLEILTINNLFSGIVAANVFLMGFLLSGVLSDFKESEKIPGEIASSLLVIHAEFVYLHKQNKTDSTKKCVDYVKSLAGSFVLWFHRKERTKALLQKVRQMNDHFSEIEKLTQANYIVRLKNEMTFLTKIIIRTDTIRDTNFISSGYLIASIVTILLSIGLILSKIEPFYESLFFAGIISFLMVFLLLLIHDLDNPFNTNEKRSAENVSIFPIERAISEMEEDN